MWWPIGLFTGLGLLLGYFVFGDARSVAVDRQTLEVRFRWPRPARRIDLRELAGVSIKLMGTEHPSPHLVIELRDGEIIEGEGTNCPPCVTDARDAINLAIIGLRHSN